VVNQLIYIFKILLLHYPLFMLFICNMFFIITLIYKEQKKTPAKVSELFVLVESFRISNFKKTFVILISYFSLNIGLILSLRISILGSYRSVVTLKWETSSMALILILSLFVLVFLLKKVLKDIAVKEIFKVYLYLYSKKNSKSILEYFFNAFPSSKQNKHINYLYKLFLHIQPMYKLPSYIRSYYANGEFNISLNTLDSIRYFLSKHLWISRCITKMVHLLSSLNNYWWPLRYYSIYFLSFLILIYDLGNERLYYIYFMLFLVLLVTLYRDSLFFIGTKDFFVGDRILSEYLYKSKSLLLDAYYTETIIRDYLSNGYQKRNPLDNLIEKVPTTNPQFAQIRRIFILLGLCILSEYVLFHMFILNTLLLTIPLVILFNIILILQLPFLARAKELYHKIFCLISVVLLIINLWVYFSRHNYYYMQDTIWDYGIIIKQTFSLLEKRNFLYAYLNTILDNRTDIPAEIKGDILAKVTDEAIANNLTTETTIAQIKQYVEFLPAYFFELNRKYALLFYKKELLEQPYIIDILTKVLHWLNSIIHSIFKIK
jgi:hypothetical protein